MRWIRLASHNAPGRGRCMMELLNGMRHVVEAVEATLCMLDVLKSMRHVPVVVEIVLCMLEVLNGTQHVLVAAKVICWSYWSC